MIRNISAPKQACKRVLCLGYDESQCSIIQVLVDKGCFVDHCADPIDGSQAYDFIVSFGYRHILKKAIIERLACPILNLHISYLPFNRGAHPNFWAFYDNTPSGVSIHLIDDGVDTGPIVYQKQVQFSASEHTFLHTYKRLVSEIEALFIVNVDDIIHNKWQATPQEGEGTHHFVKDLPADFAGWQSVINTEISRLRKAANQ